MGTRPGVGGEESVIVDLPSEAGAAVETDLMLSALAPQSRDLVAREPIERPTGDVTYADRAPHATVSGRSAKTRVAGAPMLAAAAVPATPFLPSGPSQIKRIAAFMASVGLSFVIGVPLVLRVDGVWGGARSTAATASTPIPLTAPTIPQAALTPSATTQVPAVVSAVVAHPLAATTPASAPIRGGSKPPSSAKTTAATTASPPPQAPAALNTATPPPATQTPPPTPTLQHGSLIQ